MSEPLLCRGAPRDLGYDQGVALRGEVRSEARKQRGADVVRAERVARDVTRFYPHLSERLDGLSRGARVSTQHLAQLLGRELAFEEDRMRRGSAGLALALTPERTNGGPLVARIVDLPRERTPGWRLRRSAPENDHRSLEAVLPWALAPLAGVNQHGLAVTATSVPPGKRAVADCLAPAALLVQECLQRFDRVESAAEWCERRPAGGSASILLADADGNVAEVTVDGRRRRRRPPSQGVLIGRGRSLRCSTVEKACLEQTGVGIQEFFSMLRSHDGTARGDDDSTCRHGEEQSTVGLVLLEPAEGRLWYTDEPPCRTDPSALIAVAV